MNKNKIIETTSLQAKTLQLKNYSEKIKLLYSLAKNNASLRNQILAKARNNSIKFNSINTNNQHPALGKAREQGEGKVVVPSAFSLGLKAGVAIAAHSRGAGASLPHARFPLRVSVPDPMMRLSRGSGSDKREWPVAAAPLNTKLGQIAKIDTVHSRSGRRAFLKTPLVRISGILHKHIKSVWQPTNTLQFVSSYAAAEEAQTLTLPQTLRRGWNAELANNNTIVYNFNNNFKKFKLTSILENSFFSINRLISKPVLNIKPNKVIIQLFFFSPTLPHAPVALRTERLGSPSLITKREQREDVAAAPLAWPVPSSASRKAGSGSDGGVLTNLANSLKSKSMQLQNLCAFLSKKLKKPVEFELIRLHHPSLESHILANTIGYIAKNSRKTFRVIMLKLFKSTKIKKFNEFKNINNIKKFKPTALVGIRIKLGGRLLSQKIVPRFTSRTIQRGNLGKTKADFITTSRFTNKNKRGAFSFTIKMGHNFF